MAKSEQTTAAYDALANQFIADFDSRGARVSDILRALELFHRTNPHVLEIGCANGRDAKVILEHTPYYTGIDSTPKFIEAAKKNCPTGSFEVADFTKYNYPKGLDIIFGFASLLHADQEALKKLFSEFDVSLNPGGIIYLSLQYGNYKEVKREEDGQVRYFYLYTPELIQNLAGANFEPVYEDIQELNRKWFTLALKKK